MKHEEGLYEKLSIALKEKFPNAKVIEVFDETFIYGLEENEEFSYYIVEYNIAPSGNLNIEWENAGQTNP